MSFRVMATFLLLPVVCGCNSTTHSGELNPRYQSYVLVSPLIAVDGASATLIEQQLVEQLRSDGVAATSIREVVKWARNDEEAQKSVEGVRFESIVFVSVGEGVKENTLYQSTTSGSAQSFGAYASYSGSTTTIPLKSISRDMGAGVEVRDCRTNAKGTFLRECDLVWKGSALRHAQGLAFTGTEQMVDHTVDGILAALREDGLIH